jgi:multidrug efflux pump subunit AcrB
MELVFTTFALFLLTVVASYIFYKRIKMAQHEYDSSKNTVRNITFGFTRQVKRMESDLDRIEKEALQARHLANQALNSNQGNNDATRTGLEEVKELSQRVEGIEESIDTMKKDLSKLASQPRILVSSQNSVEAPIPVQGDDILQELTETELEVLKMIVDSNEGTVPEIKEQISKTREHTARLLKKLYDKGFIDRNTSNMPYRYSIRKEIRELIMEQNEPKSLGL